MYDRYLKGWDWTQVAQCLIRNKSKVSTDEAAEEIIKAYVEEALDEYGNQYSSGNKKKVSRKAKRTLVICREYVRKAGNRKMNDSPAWIGINNIKCDYTFLQFFLHLYTWMWD